MAQIVFENVSKAYTQGTYALSELDLTVSDGEFMVFVGPSGCGKSTALRMIAGLEDVTAGTIMIDGRIVNDVDPKERDVAMVFQNYALYPHMSVEDNLGFGLKLRRVPRDERRQRVLEVASTLDLDQYLHRKPAALSGGQRQRVAMGRAIVRAPQAYLMDEPLSNLDAKLRVQMRSMLARLHARLGTTTIYVTHDQVEAMTLGDRVAVFRDGQLQQLATPLDLFERPTNLFVAAFIGSPAMNFVAADVVDDQQLAFGGHRLRLPPNAAVRGELSAWAGRKILLGVRPQSFSLGAASPEETPEGMSLAVTVGLVELLGTEVDLEFALGIDHDDVLESADSAVLADAGHLPGEGVTWRARVPARTRPNPGDRLLLEVQAGELYLFDPQTGHAISHG